MPARQFDCLATLGLFVLCTATVWADEAPPFDSNKIAAVATDAPTTPVPDPRIVAQEILRLQEEMGGSIVSRMEPSPAWNAAPTTHPVGRPWRPTFNSPIVALRETAWQLEQSAYLLESLDLYDQADALRDTADRLRQDARKFKASAASSRPKNPRVGTAQAEPLGP